MAYADYNFYTSDYFGKKIPEEDFPYFAERATEYIDSLPVVTTDEVTLSKACCSCAEILYKSQPAHQVTSEKVGDYSVNYNISNQTSVADELLKQTKIYLDVNSVRWV